MCVCMCVRACVHASMYVYLLDFSNGTEFDTGQNAKYLQSPPFSLYSAFNDDMRTYLPGFSCSFAYMISHRFIKKPKFMNNIFITYTIY